MKTGSNIFDAAITSIVNDAMNNNKESIINAYCNGDWLLVDPYSGTVKAVKAVDVYKTKEELESED